MLISLIQLFTYICSDAEYISVKSRCVCNNRSGDLFGEISNTIENFSKAGAKDYFIVAALHSDTSIDLSSLPPDICRLYELSADAFDAVVHAWMSELPITAEIIRFGKKIVTAADAVVTIGSAERSESESMQRQAAGRAATDRGDPDVRAVHEAAFKTWREIHRLMGLLRFCPDEDGVYTAHCEPDHFILPALGPHFKERFGETPWAIIDEKRRLCMRCMPGDTVVISGINNDSVFAGTSQDGEWENLWRNYHKTINNPGRSNPDLQKQFMPKRYWKYLTEMGEEG